MKSIIAVSVALFGIILAQNAFACEEPAGIGLPDGSTASEKEMLAAGQQYRQFMIDMQSYQECLDNEANRERVQSKNDGKRKITSRENKYASLHNAASAAMEQTTEAFNITIEKYQARQ